jgi:hypothetical protein
MMDKVQKPNDTECYTPPEPFRLYKNMTDVLFCQVKRIYTFHHVVYPFSDISYVYWTKMEQHISSYQYFTILSRHLLSYWNRIVS